MTDPWTHTWSTGVITVPAPFAQGIPIFMDQFTWILGHNPVHGLQRMSLTARNASSTRRTFNEKNIQLKPKRLRSPCTENAAMASNGPTSDHDEELNMNAPASMWDVMGPKSQHQQLMNTVPMMAKARYTQGLFFSNATQLNGLVASHRLRIYRCF